MSEIEKVRAELGSLALRLDVLERKTDKEWPQIDDEYWVVGLNNITFASNFDDDITDLRRKSAHNMLRTEEEAQAKADWRQMTDDLWAYAKEVNNGEAIETCHVIVRNTDMKIVVTRSLCSYGTARFASYKAAEQAADHFGDRLHILFDYKG